ncbi:MAG: hypothetical protein KME16_15695 [Scytolyngbya sp. HA4215-MV1]|jgi:glucan phosphoethanolaminetransferase (alkaline phosphatase superfamily)|nr:hypothetical protein [Scytolyngbya sp. HA4215-MV1]
MTSSRKLPWLSFTLLLVSYTCFGWFISDRFGWFFASTTLPKVVWLLAFAWAFFIDTAFIAPLTYGSRLVARWFRSDTVAFLTVFSVIAGFMMLLFWLQIFAYIVLIISAEALARVDMQTDGFSPKQAFWFLAILSLLGLICGGILHHYAIEDELLCSLLNQFMSEHQCQILINGNH